MTRPIEETWHLEHLLVINQAGKPRFGSGSRVGVDFDEDQAALRLAAQAPAMARLLLSEDRWHHAECVVCGGHRHQEGHAPDCALIAVLRAAGVVE